MNATAAAATDADPHTGRWKAFLKDCRNESDLADPMQGSGHAPSRGGSSPFLS